MKMKKRLSEKRAAFSFCLLYTAEKTRYAMIQEKESD